MLFVGKNTSPVRRDLHQNLMNSGPDRFVALLQLSVSTRGVIGHFAGRISLKQTIARNRAAQRKCCRNMSVFHCTARETLSSFLINLGDLINILLAY